MTAVDAAVVPISPLMSELNPELVMPALPPKDPNDVAAPKAMGVGDGGKAQKAAVNDQTKSAAMELAGMARSLTPVVPPPTETW